ncbi:Uncharacterized protein APZ42_018253, partial [Daphnia magna]
KFHLGAAISDIDNDYVRRCNNFVSSGQMNNDIYIQTRQLVPHNQNDQISIAQLFIFYRRPSRSSNKKQQLHYEASSKHNLTVVAHHTDISTLLSVPQV